MKAVAPLHVAILVSDLERAKLFYGGILGLEQKPRPNLESPGVWYDLGGELELHLIVTTQHLAPASQRPNKDSHLALAVADLDLIKRDLSDADVPFREGSTVPPQLFVRDPDGNLIELQKL